MLTIRDDGLPDQIANVEIVNRVGSRQIECAFHDIDGTHSTIRRWEPVMSRVLYTVIMDGIPPDCDTSAAVARISGLSGTESLPETDRFCTESAGLSAITQMEWAIRRGIEEGTVKIPGFEYGAEVLHINSMVINRIWQGVESNPMWEPDELREFLTAQTPRLFLLYEKVLHHNCRNRNLELAREDPQEWRIRGSLEFVVALYRKGVKNYFVTGSVVQTDCQGRIAGGIYEEVLALGFEIGAGRMVEAIFGSRWDQRMPKNQVIKDLGRQLNVDAGNLLVLGDGRTEVKIGVQMGAVTVSRLPLEASRQRELHRDLGTNYIVTDFGEPGFSHLIPGLYDAGDP